MGGKRQGQRKTQRPSGPSGTTQTRLGPFLLLALAFVGVVGWRVCGPESGAGDHVVVIAGGPVHR